MTTTVDRPTRDLAKTARSHARDVRDLRHREALAALLDDLVFLLDEVDGGLHAGVPDGLHVDSIVVANLRFGTAVLGELAERVRGGDTWMTSAAALRRQEDLDARLGAVEPVYHFTGDELDELRSREFRLGARAANLVDA
jgi:hypothetical protein